MLKPYTKMRYIRYHDALGNIIKSQEVSKNEKVNIVKDYPMVEAITLTTKHDGWSLTKGSTADISGSYQVNDKSINLYPIIKNGYWISFQTNSEASIAKQFIDLKDSVKKVKKPSDPYKKGYVFTKWYEDEKLTKEYDFDKEVTKPMTLYAGYEADDNTSYVVKYYLEYQKEIKNDVWDYKEIAKEYRKGKTNDKALFDENFIYQAPYNVDQKGYELDEGKTVDTFIKADGTTVYKVYYKAKLYDVTFTTRYRYRKDNAITTLPEILKLEYKGLKYTQDLKFIWDILEEKGALKYMRENNMRFVSEDETNTFVKPYYSEYSVVRATNILLAVETHGKENSFYKVYLEVLDGEAPEGKTKEKNNSLRSENDNREYFLDQQGSFTSGINGGVGYGSAGSYRKGFTLAPELSDGHYRVRKDGSIGIWFRYHKGWDRVNQLVDENGNGINYYGENHPVNIYFTRNKYKIIYETNGAPVVENVEGIPFERNINYLAKYGYEEGISKITIEDREMVFSGWYTDVALKEKFDFNTTMPAQDIILYAKWVPKTYIVKFNTNGGTKVETKDNVEYGHTVTEPVTKKDGYIFLGWSYKNRPFNFASGITEDMTLNAEWKSIKAYKVLYDLNGGKGETPLDNDKYYAGAGAIVLKHDDIIAPFNKVFVGWGLDGNIYYPNNLAEVKEGGIVLKAIWKDKYKETGDIMPNTGVEKTVSLQSLIIINLIFLTLALGTYKFKNNN